MNTGHSGGDPAPLAPRYEFLENLIRGQHGISANNSIVQRNVELLVSSLARTKFSFDREHNFMSHHSLVKIIPAVVFEAHEKCKAMARTLEGELKSMVIANLERVRQLRGGPAEVRFRPVGVREYLERYQLAKAERQKSELDQ